MTNEVSAFYEDTNILITGSTGFVGKVLTQKLLRCCKNVHIYLLVRSKKNVSPQDRLDAIFKDSLFDTLKAEFPNFLTCVTVIEGDMSCMSLKLSQHVTDELVSKINIVFHCAADLNMNQFVAKSVDTNVRGTHELLRICKRMKHLKAFMLVSSIYATTDLQTEEKFYDTKISPKLIMNMCEELDESALDNLKTNDVREEHISLKLNIGENDET